MIEGVGCEIKEAAKLFLNRNQNPAKALCNPSALRPFQTEFGKSEERVNDATGLSTHPSSRATDFAHMDDTIH